MTTRECGLLLVGIACGGLATLVLTAQDRTLAKRDREVAAEVRAKLEKMMKEEEGYLKEARSAWLKADRCRQNAEKFAAEARGGR
jgi:hypothetical protein